MSLKKDKFESLDKKFMQVAINLANNQKSLTGLNPSVGCVVVKNKKIISFAVTNINGRPHAETIALNKKKNLIKGSTMYITLEPCSHYGKTPPCTKSIINSKIKKVIFSTEDLDERSYNKSKKILNSKKIVTKSGLLRDKAKILYKNYNYIKKNKYPYIIGKLACSSNLFILKNNTLITNEHSRKVSHLLRYENHGILTSYKTVNSDNPKLNCRLNGLERFSPTRLIIDRDLKIKKNSYIVNNSKKKTTYVFYNSKDKKKINYFKKKGIKLIYQEIDVNGLFNLDKLFKKIYEIGVQKLLIECGKKFTLDVLSKSFFNEFYLFKSNKKINKKDMISINVILKNLNKTFKNKKPVNTFLDKDKLIKYY